jgi:hypothetical protein
VEIFSLLKVLNRGRAGFAADTGRAAHPKKLRCGRRLRDERGLPLASNERCSPPERRGILSRSPG